MSFRDGSLSTFSESTLDHFQIKYPFNTPASGFGGAGTDIEKANHFNHYFDACLKMQQYLYGTINNHLQARYSATYSSALVPASAFIFSFDTITETLTGAVASIPLTVPEIFGADPFSDGRFAIAHTAYYQSSASGLSTYLNNPTDPSLFNALINHPQFYILMQPTGGRTFTLSVCAMRYGLNTPLYTSFSDGFEGRTIPQDGALLGNTWQDEQRMGGGRQRAFRILNGTYNAVSRNALRMRSRNNYREDSYRQEGWALPATFTECYDQSVEFEYLELHTTNVGTNQYWNRCGIMLRAAGSVNAATFYGFGITDSLKQTNVPVKGRILLVRGTNLLDTDHAEDLDEEWYNFGTTVTQLGSSFEVYSLVEAVASGLATTSVRYKFSAIGTTIKVERSLDSAAWVTIASVTDPSLRYGRVGVYSRGLGNNNTVHRENTIDNFVATNLDAPPQLSINLLYTRIGDSDKVGNQNI
jgi:hypothetical protein